MIASLLKSLAAPVVKRLRRRPRVWLFVTLKDGRVLADRVKWPAEDIDRIEVQWPDGPPDREPGEDEAAP